MASLTFKNVVKSKYIFAIMGYGDMNLNLKETSLFKCLMFYLRYYMLLIL